MAALPPVQPLEFTTCEAEAAGQLNQQIAQQLQDAVNEKTGAMDALHAQACVYTGNLQRSLDIAYQLGYHHYTLYYYDRAGNLVRTVPPEDVDLSSTTSRNDHLTHNLVTTYE